MNTRQGALSSAKYVYGNDAHNNHIIRLYDFIVGLVDFSRNLAWACVCVFVLYSRKCFADMKMK